jgi:hypothetical protein
MKTLNVSTLIEKTEKCAYCGAEKKLTPEEEETTIFICQECNRENVAWDLRKGFFGDPEYKETPVLWLFVGIISAVLGLFLIPPVFGIFGMFCGYRCLSKGCYFAGGLVVLISLIFMIMSMILGTHYFRNLI